MSTPKLNAFSAGAIAAQPAPEASSCSEIALDALDNALTRAALSYWRLLRGPRGLPARTQLAPRDMRPLLRNVSLLRLIEGGRDYEYRIVGDMFAWAHETEFRGMRISQLEQTEPAHGTLMRGLCEHVRAGAAPLAIQGWVGREFPRAKFVYYESVLLPLGEDGRTVDHILVVSFYVPKTSERVSLGL